MSIPPKNHELTKLEKVKRVFTHGCGTVWRGIRYVQIKSLALCCPRKVRFLPVDKAELDDARDTIRARAVAFTPPPYQDLTRVRKCTVDLPPGKYEFIFRIDDMYELAPGKRAVPPKVNKLTVKSEAFLKTKVPSGKSKPLAYSIVPVVFTYVGVGHTVHLLIRKLHSKDRFREHRMLFDDEEDFPALGSLRPAEEHPKHYGSDSSDESSSVFYEAGSGSSDSSSDSSDDSDDSDDSSADSSEDSEISTLGDSSDDSDDSSSETLVLKYIDRFDTHGSASSSASSDDSSSSTDSDNSSSADSSATSSSTDSSST